MLRRFLLTLPFLALSATGCAAHSAYVRVPPPPPRVEYYGTAPGPGFVWVDGNWAWRSSRYYWAPGYWSRPPRPHGRWVQGGWFYRHGRYYYRPGCWR